MYCVRVFHSEVTRFYDPSDLCCTGEMYCRGICSNPRWQGKYDRRDAMSGTDSLLVGVRQYARHALGTISRALLFFSYLVIGIIHIYLYAGLFHAVNRMTIQCGSYNQNLVTTPAIIHLDSVTCVRIFSSYCMNHVHSLASPSY